MRPIVVSFYSSSQYYLEAAVRLRDDCTRVGLDHEIVPLASTGSDDWVAVCRRKIPFYLEMHRKHRRPILWLDVDSRLARHPEIFDDAPCDIAAFLRGFRYLRDFDPLSAPRFFAPFALYFNATPRARAFLELMADLERHHQGNATDDFFLHEAWKKHREQLSAMILPPDLVGHEWPLSGDQAIYVGISGNVGKFKGQAEQHTPAVLAPEHRQAVLLYEGESELKEGRTDEALMLFRRALAAAPESALADRIGRLMRRAENREQSDKTRRTDATYHSVDRSKEPFWKRWLSSSRSG